MLKENAEETSAIDFTSGDELLYLISKEIISKFANNKHEEALLYIYNILPSFRANNKYEKMFRIEMTYLEQLSQSSNSNKTAGLFYEFLREMLSLVQNKLQDVDYQECFFN